jgi:hypothetical protein
LQGEFINNSKGGKSVIINNKGLETAFFVRLKVVDEKSGELALPVYFSDNYITLFPSESREINVDLTLLSDGIKSRSLRIEMEGWNIKNQFIK